MMLIPSGIAESAQPCRARPINTGRSEAETAQTMDPAISAVRAITIIRRLPNMSPSRPATGVKTAEASRVIVSTQAASARLVCSSVCRLGTSGTTRVIMTDTTMPAKASAATISPLGRPVPVVFFMEIVSPTENGA